MGIIPKVIVLKNCRISDQDNGAGNNVNASSYDHIKILTRLWNSQRGEWSED